MTSRRVPGHILLCVALAAAACADALPRAAAQAPDQPPAQQTATIHGIVLAANDRKPIPQAVVTLSTSQRSALTDDKGQFVFTGVPFGTEVAVAKKANFLCSGWHGPRPQCVKNVDVFTPDTQVELTMLPEAIVTGRITDQTGAPVQNLELQLMDKGITREGRYAWSILGATTVRTNADGVFRMHQIEPGTYLLHIPAAFDPPDAFPPPHPENGYAATYYPGTTDQAEAQPLVIHAGDAIRADVILKRERVQPVTLSYVWNRKEDPGTIGFGTSDATGTVLLAGGPVEHSHTVRFLAPPGDYKAGLALSSPTDPKTGDPIPWADGTKQPYMGRAKFTVRDQPVTIDDIPLQQPVTVPVRFHVELKDANKATTPQRDDLAMAVIVFELWGHEGQGDQRLVWTDGKPLSNAAFENVLPGQYKLSVLGTVGHSSAYVASLTCGAINLQREPLAIGPGIPTCAIDAVIRDDLATVAIGLTPQAIAQMAAHGTGVTDFALIPLEDTSSLPYSGLAWREAKPKTAAIPPGKYLAFLFDGRGLAWRDPEVWKQLLRLGTPVTLAPGGSKTVLLDFQPELDSPKTAVGGVSFGQVLP